MKDICLTFPFPPLRVNYDPDSISKEIDVDEKGKGKVKARISRFCDPGDELHHVAFGECKTLHDCFKRGLRVSNDGPCLGWRPEPGKIIFALAWVVTWYT